MSYTVLARRYRSGTFDEVVGQNHIAQTLKKAIASGRIAHAYLFCGTRGTGKTSTARILAKALNCETGKNGPVTEPCGKCESCLGIARGDDIDVIEIDAASNTGVDNIRELIENSQYRPARSRFKVYIIDEVHMLSKSAFNALLKTLEEPPSHVKFILATTEPEKVLATILSRCQRYDFRNIPTREIAAHLASICKQEKIQADEEALFLVAKAGAGSMRDALSLLDRLLSLGEKHLSSDMIEGLLGLPKSQLLFELADAIGRGDVKAALAQTDAMIQSGLSVDAFLASLIDHLRNLLILRACGNDSNLVEVPGLSLAELTKQAQRFETVTLAQDIAILEELRRQARQSNAGRALLDATLVRLALSEQFSSVADLMARVGGAPSIATQKKKLEAVEGSGFGVQGSGNTNPNKPEAEAGGDAPGSLDADASVPTPEPKPNLSPQSSVLSPSSVPTPAAPMDFDLGDSDDGDSLPTVGKVWDDGPKLSLATIMARDKQKTQVAPSTPIAGDSNIEPIDPTDLPAVHRAMLALIARHGPSLQGLLSQGQFAGVEDGRAILRYPKSQETTVRLLDRNGKRELVVDALSQILNQPVGVRFEIDPNDDSLAAPTTSIASARPAASRPTNSAPAPAPEPPAAPSIRVTAELRAELEQDPLIRSLIELGGSIVKVE
jgi:DNA polymerase-3 subunit gamma/tau